MADKIWCLFSVENNYDQPANNLDAWWWNKPSIERLAAYLNCPLDQATDIQVVAIVDIWRGEGSEFGVGGTRFRLEEVPEGKVE